jgi:two-component system, LytTR family, sensor kinase
VPSLVLQPLVENSIRHGVGKRAGPAWIRIAAERSGNTLMLRVTDNGAGFEEEATKPIHEGMGLAITRGRLESLYGPHQSLVLRNLPAGGVEARITLPFRIQAAESQAEAAGQDRNKGHVELQSADRR